MNMNIIKEAYMKQAKIVAEKTEMPNLVNQLKTLFDSKTNELVNEDDDFKEAIVRSLFDDLNQLANNDFFEFNINALIHKSKTTEPSDVKEVTKNTEIDNKPEKPKLNDSIYDDVTSHDSTSPDDHHVLEDEDEKLAEKLQEEECAQIGFPEGDALRYAPPSSFVPPTFDEDDIMFTKKDYKELLERGYYGGSHARVFNNRRNMNNPQNIPNQQTATNDNSEDTSDDEEHPPRKRAKKDQEPTDRRRNNRP